MAVSEGDKRAQHLGAEQGTVFKQAAERVALVYPSPYHVGMSSLGFQTLYREINLHSPHSAERAFLPDKDASPSGALRTYESHTPVSHFPVVAVSVAYELEIAGLVSLLERCGIPPLASQRSEQHPLILAGGPLTFSNPLPLAPFVDAILMGEADQTIHQALEIIFSGRNRKAVLTELASTIPSCFVPQLHGDALPSAAKCTDDRLPAFSQIITPHTELRNMFLIEAARGCSRGCEYCVMRRSTNGGMRIVPQDRILGLVPSHAKRVGLVGAAVSDHPHISEIIETLVTQGKEVSLSSLRPDRLNDRFVAALKSAGYKTLTTASDGASQRLRDRIQRKTREKHIVRAAELARTHGLRRLKLYTMLGLPDENEQDVQELIDFSLELSKTIPISLGIAPFVSKRNTPLDNLPFAGIECVQERLEHLRKGVRGRVEIRSTSARWAWVEYRLAQGGVAEGRAVYRAVKQGASFRAWKAALDEVEQQTPKRTLQIINAA